MAKKQNSNWMAIVGLVLLVVGLVSSGFSSPPSDLYDHDGERQSTLLVFVGLTGTIVGLVLLMVVARKTTKSMAPEYKTRANIGVGIGIILQLAGFLAFRVGVGGPQVVPLLTPGSPSGFLFLLSVPVLAWGCMSYAAGKGRSKWLGLVGVLGSFGLAVLTAIPDQHEGHEVDAVDHDGDPKKTLPPSSGDLMDPAS